MAKLLIIVFISAGIPLERDASLPSMPR